MKGAFIFKHVFTKFFGLTKGRPVSFAYPTWSLKGSRRKGFFSDRVGAAGPVFVSGAAAARGRYFLLSVYVLLRVWRRSSWISATDLHISCDPKKTVILSLLSPRCFVPVVSEATVWWFSFPCSNTSA